MNRRWLCTLGIFVPCVMSARIASADLKECTQLSENSSDYKVVLDDLSFASPAAEGNSDLSALKDSLQFDFTGQLDRLKASAKRLDRKLQVPLRLVFCEGRKPSISGAEFTPARAERLSDERVVVEMWGTLELVTSGAQPPQPRATIGYSIPPVQHYVAEDQAPSIHLARYPKSGQPQSVDELKNLPELAAFALVGLGTKAMRANLYDLAVWAFTQAKSGIADAQLAGTNATLDALLVYVKRASCLTRANALANKDYNGNLRLASTQDCTEAP